MGSGMGKAVQKREKQEWASKSQSSIMLENWEVIISLVRQMRSSRKPPETRGKLVSSNGSIHALQDQEKQVRGDL